MIQANGDDKITVYCSGGCGRSMQLPKTSVFEGDYYGCDENKQGFECEAKLLPLIPGKVRITTEFKGRHFFRIRDVWPDAEMVVTTWGSYEIWAGKVAMIVIDKVMKMARGEKYIETIRDSLVHYEKLPRWMD
jgi:hypothetical protein